MFAGAAREAVFANPDVVRRVQTDFVPVALKAALVNNPPAGDEGQLYREIGRSKPAPQGICVINRAGKVLDWALMFDDDASVLAFLDHCARRFARYPDAKQPVAAERYQKFPSQKLDDVPDTRQPLPAGDRHAKGTFCPGTPPVLPGTVVARLVGRALGKDGKPVADTVRQEHYVEDRFHIPVELQAQLAKAGKAAAAERFRLPEPFARHLVSHAYLGQLDVNPVGAPGGTGALKRCDFWGRHAGDTPTRIRVEGHSEAAGSSAGGQAGDGRVWEHEVRLAWEGWIEMDGDRIGRILLTARGAEKLRWGNGRQGLWAEADVTHLPGGHPIDLACGVHYGLIGEPAAAEEVATDAPPGPDGLPVAPVPEEARRQLTEALGPPFLIFRGKVQQELKLSAEQKERLDGRLATTIQETMAFFQKLDGRPPAEREEAVAAYRTKAQARLAGALEELLNENQRRRLRQLQLQLEGPFALGGEVGNELRLTDDQRRQFMTVVQDMQKRIEPLIKQAQAGGKPQEIRPKIMRIRDDHARRIEAVLTDAQRKQWRDLLGKPFDLGE